MPAQRIERIDKSVIIVTGSQYQAGQGAALSTMDKFLHSGRGYAGELIDVGDAGFTESRGLVRKTIGKSLRLGRKQVDVVGVGEQGLVAAVAALEQPTLPTRFRAITVDTRIAPTDSPLVKVSQFEREGQQHLSTLLRGNEDLVTPETVIHVVFPSSREQFLGSNAKVVFIDPHRGNYDDLGPTIGLYQLDDEVSSGRLIAA